MNIGEEEEAIEMPMPLAPGQTPVHEPSPVVEPVKEPAHAELVMVGRKPGTCGCECCYGGFCGGCGHAGCGGR